MLEGVKQFVFHIHLEILGMFFIYKILCHLNLTDIQFVNYFAQHDFIFVGISIFNIIVTVKWCLQVHCLPAICKQSDSHAVYLDSLHLNNSLLLKICLKSSPSAIISHSFCYFNKDQGVLKVFSTPIWLPYVMYHWKHGKTVILQIYESLPWHNPYGDEYVHTKYMYASEIILKFC